MLSSLQKHRADSCYLFLTALFSVVLVLTNIIGAKIFEGPFNPVQHALTTGILTYPITFLLTDVVSEIWGAKKANMMVYIGFIMSLVMLAIVQLALYVPAHPFWLTPDNPFGYTTVDQYQNAYSSVFSVNGKLLFGSMLAFVVAQLLDVKLFHFFKRLTHGKYLWLRNNASTWVSQLADTFIVNSILFYWAFGWEFSTGIQVMITIYLYKMFIALVDTPLIYLAVFALRKSFGLNSNESLAESA